MYHMRTNDHLESVKGKITWGKNYVKFFKKSVQKMLNLRSFLVATF